MTNNLTEKQLAAQQLLMKLENARISLLEENCQLKLQHCSNNTSEWLNKKTVINNDITQICKHKLEIIYTCF